ncbi:hypothetical protein C444_06026 [Haloarcula japonica DSM 6131]|uniref:Uncharacterized protein n=1 Tax=Haloarcula japonica (strain ATCC 49778 / DSM 6131 / JCM 7785 / NBRC 101032 / NCIMB 13157 / TR-1) TaxID=1227453 RepID=M0LGV1_HALJT|nr:hypothetical protein C444_06026 [Haloarcula japonica DSM 6131]
MAVRRSRLKQDSVAPVKTLLYLIGNSNDIHRFAKRLNKEIRIHIKCVLIISPSNFTLIPLNAIGDPQHGEFVQVVAHPPGNECICCCPVTDDFVSILNRSRPNWRVALLVEHQKCIQYQMAMLCKSSNALSDTTSFKRGSCSIHMGFSEVRGVFLNRNVTRFHQEVKALAGVASVFCTEGSTFCNYLLWDDAIIKSDLSTLAKDIAKFTRVVRWKLKFLFTEARLDLRTESFAVLKIV